MALHGALHFVQSRVVSWHAAKCYNYAVGERDDGHYMASRGWEPKVPGGSWPLHTRSMKGGRGSAATGTAEDGAAGTRADEVAAAGEDVDTAVASGTANVGAFL